MAITLQSTVGGFSSEFMRRLPGRRAGHGRAWAGAVAVRDLEGLGDAGHDAFACSVPFFYDYTVFVGEENFTVTEPNDIRFLDYFYQRCIAEDDDGARTATPAACRPDQPHLPLDGAADLELSYSPHCRASVASAQPSQ